MHTLTSAANAGKYLPDWKNKTKKKIKQEGTK